MNDLVVIGQGYVGLPLSRAATKAGLKVVGLDLNQKAVNNLNRAISHVGDVSDEDLQRMLDAGYVATSNSAVLGNARFIVICVPTPLGDAGRPDLSAVESATRAIAKHMTAGTTVILESTTYPGTTQEFVLPLLEGTGKSIDNDFWLAFSPERIDPGNENFGLENTPKVVGGVTNASTDKAISLYSRFVESVVRVRSSREAETAKLLENTYRHINIALVNEMAKFCHELEVDLWDVIDAAKTKPFGFQAFYPGPGVGGHCIPIDPNYLSYQVKKTLGYPFRFVELAEEINNSMPRYVVERIQDELNNRKKSLNGATVLLLGVAYKPNISDQRESPAAPIARLLQEKGASISYHDPRVPSWSLDGVAFDSEDNLNDAIETADIVVLLQQHKEYNFESIAKNAKLFFDTRGVSTKSPNTFKL